MSQGPNVVFKIRYYQPGDASLDASNPMNLERIKNRNYYSSNGGENDFLKYIDDGIKRGNGFDYMDYMTSHDKSSGVFGKNGLLTAEQKKEVRNLLRKTKSVIWDALLSFSEDYGKEKIKSYEDAMEIVKHNLPKFLKENGIDEDNVIWFAGLHRNTDNLHIHISFFELDDAFFGCTSLTSITIPDSVTTIGYDAFYNCTSLTSINVDKGNKYYTSIDGNLYNKNKTTLIQYAIGKDDKSFIIPDSVTTIGRAAFSGCTSLTSITIPDSVTTIGDYAFYGCTSLTIYCEAKRRPSGWYSDWNLSNCPVYWGINDN